MIIFGYRYFKIKSFTPGELGLPDSLVEPYTIERRQRYFHLFFIPFLAIGKIWGIRKQDDKVYKVPEQIELYLKNKKIKFSTPWYSYLGPIVILVYVLIVLIEDLRFSRKRAEINKNEFNQESELLLSKLNDPTTNDYYIFEIYKEGEEHYTTQTAFKVKEVKGDSVLLVSGYKNLFEEAHFDGNEYKEDAKVTRKRKILRIFDSVSVATNPTWWIHKNDLKATVCNDFSKKENFKGTKLLALDKNYLLKLTIIEMIDGPFFLFIDHRNYADSNFTGTIQNEGLKTIITKIVAIEGFSQPSIEWESFGKTYHNLPLEVTTGYDFKVEGRRNTDFSFEIHCIGYSKKEFIFLVEGKEYTYKISRRAK
jgi:hypothetical protein